MDKYTKLNLSSVVLITIYVQNDFTLPGAPAEMPGTLQAIPPDR